MSACRQAIILPAAGRPEGEATSRPGWRAHHLSGVVRREEEGKEDGTQDYPGTRYKPPAMPTPKEKYVLEKTRPTRSTEPINSTEKRRPKQRLSIAKRRPRRWI